MSVLLLGTSKLTKVIKYIAKCESAHFIGSAFFSCLVCSGFSFLLHFSKYYTTQHYEYSAKNSYLTWSSSFKLRRDLSIAENTYF